MALHPLRRGIGVLLAIGAAGIGACRQSGAGGAFDPSPPSAVAALTPAASTGPASTDQAQANAFAQQAQAYAALATADRARATALAAAIAGEAQQVTARATAAAATAAAPGPVAPVAAASALTIAATALTLGTPSTSAVAPPAAAKLESHYQKEAALADRLGANAQRLASFHLAQANRAAGAAGKGGAQ